MVILLLTFLSVHNTFMGSKLDIKSSNVIISVEKHLFYEISIFLENGEKEFFCYYFRNTLGHTLPNPTIGFLVPSNLPFTGYRTTVISYITWSGDITRFSRNSKPSQLKKRIDFPPSVKIDMING